MTFRSGDEREVLAAFVEWLQERSLNLYLRRVDTEIPGYLAIRPQTVEQVRELIESFVESRKVK